MKTTMNSITTNKEMRCNLQQIDEKQFKSPSGKTKDDHTSVKKKKEVNKRNEYCITKLYSQLLHVATRDCIDESITEFMN